MITYNRKSENAPKTKKRLQLICVLSVGVASIIHSAASLADTSQGKMAVSLAIMSSNNPENARRNFGTSHYTWGAAEISLTKAGYKKPIRIATVDEVYWFTVPVCGKPTVIGVSVNSGEIMQTYQAAN